MRWVILFFVVASTLIWDGWYNGGVWTDASMRWIVSIMSGLMAYFK